MRQDDPENKPHSVVADFSYLYTTIEQAIKGIPMKRIFI